jgi:hypothetical protein
MRGLLLLISICLVPWPVMADATPAARAQAKQHYEVGERSFRLGDFDEAIREWRHSYELSSVPMLLYNIGQAYRQKGDAKQALFFYQQYLAAGATGESRDAAEQKIEELRKIIAYQKNANTPPSQRSESPSTSESATSTIRQPPRRAPTAVIAPSVSATDTRGGRTKMIAGGSIAGFGVAAIAAGIGFFAVANSANDSVNHPSNGTFSAGAEARPNTFQSLDIAAFVVGGTAIATGVTVAILGWRQRHHVTVTPAASTNDAGAMLNVTF